MGCSQASGRYETVEDHLGLMKVAAERLYPGYAQRINGLAARLMGSPPKVPPLHLSMALHDIGKTLEAYQRSLRSKCTARLHELASAAMVLTVKTLEDVKYEKLAALLAVALHHHSMRTISGLVERADEVLRYIEGSDLAMTRQYVERYLSAASRIYGIELSLAEPFDFNTLKSSLTLVKEVLKKLQQLTSLTGSQRTQMVRLYVLATAMLSPLVTSDIASARANREGMSLDEALTARHDPLLLEVARWAERGQRLKSMLKGLL